MRRLIDNLVENLGTRVYVQQGSKGNGTLVIAYNSLGELDGILIRIKQPPAMSGAPATTSECFQYLTCRPAS